MSGYYFGVGAVLVFWILSYYHTKDPWPWALAISSGRGKDAFGKDIDVLSVSKFQAFIWTIITLFSYASIFGFRYIDSPANAIKSLPEIPINLFLLMGFSITTAAGSKSLKISYIAQGRVTKESTGLTSDLTKTQMLAWTIMGAIIYLTTVVSYISTKQFTLPGAAALPEVDQTLLLLMGVSQGSYLGNKIVSKEVIVPKISKISPTQGPTESVVTIKGENFGAQQGENYVVMHDNKIMSDKTITWTDNEIKVKILPGFNVGDKLELRVYRDTILSDKIEDVFEVKQNP